MVSVNVGKVAKVISSKDLSASKLLKKALGEVKKEEPEIRTWKKYLNERGVKYQAPEKFGGIKADRIANDIIRSNAEAKIAEDMKKIQNGKKYLQNVETHQMKGASSQGEFNQGIIKERPTLKEHFENQKKYDELYGKKIQNSSVYPIKDGQVYSDMLTTERLKNKATVKYAEKITKENFDNVKNKPVTKNLAEKLQEAKAKIVKMNVGKKFNNVKKEVVNEFEKTTQKVQDYVKTPKFKMSFKRLLVNLRTGIRDFVGQFKKFVSILKDKVKTLPKLDETKSKTKDLFSKISDKIKTFFDKLENRYESKAV